MTGKSSAKGKTTKAALQLRAFRQHKDNTNGPISEEAGGAKKRESRRHRGRRRSKKNEHELEARLRVMHAEIRDLHAEAGRLQGESSTDVTEFWTALDVHIKDSISIGIDKSLAMRNVLPFTSKEKREKHENTLHDALVTICSATIGEYILKANLAPVELALKKIVQQVKDLGS